jgi:hypothetical protein
MEALFQLCHLDRGPGRALLDATTSQGFSRQVAQQGLQAELNAWTAPGALDRVREELPADLATEERPRAVLIIAARTLPASTMRAVLMARMLDARVLLKPAKNQEAIAMAIASADPAVEVRPFHREDGPALRQAIDDVDTVVTLGTDATIAAVKAQVPAHKTFVGYGHRVSAGWLDTLDDDAAIGLARDLCAWDQAGCLSPHVIWTCANVSHAQRAIAEAVRTIEGQLPMTLDRAGARARHHATTLAEMVGSRISTPTAEVLTLDDSNFRPSPGWRTLWVLPAKKAALQMIQSQLSTLAWYGTASPPPSLDGVRICRPGEMQRPPLHWQHDGRPNLTPMLINRVHN